MTTNYYAELNDETRRLSFKYGIPLMLERELKIHGARYAREYEEEERR